MASVDPNIEANKILAFSSKINFVFYEFEQKNSQTNFFKELEASRKQIFLEIEPIAAAHTNLSDLLGAYKDKEAELENAGKTFKQIFEEKIFTDKMRIFEELLKDIFITLFEEFPFFLKHKDKDAQPIDIPVVFEDIFGTQPTLDILPIREQMINSKVTSFVMETISKAYKKLETVFGIKNLPNDGVEELQRYGLLRNIVVHNNSIINDFFVNGILGLKTLVGTSLHVYTKGDSVASRLEQEIIGLNTILNSFVPTLKEKLLEEGIIIGIINRHNQRKGTIN